VSEVSASVAPQRLHEPQQAPTYRTDTREGDAMTPTTAPRSWAELVAPLVALSAVATKLAAESATASTIAAEREAHRIRAGSRSPHVALTARLLPATHPQRAHVAALAAAQLDALPASLSYTRSDALHTLSSDADARALTAVLTARDLGHVLQPQTAWIRRRPISPRDPAPARLA